MLFINPSTSQIQLRDHLIERRLAQGLTQKGLAERSGVNLHSLRKFEREGSISLKSFLQLLMILGGLEDVVAAVKPPEEQFRSIEEVLASIEPRKVRKRGWRT